MCHGYISVCNFLRLG